MAEEQLFWNPTSSLRASCPGDADPRYALAQENSREALLFFSRPHFNYIANPGKSVVHEI